MNSIGPLAGLKIKLQIYAVKKQMKLRKFLMPFKQLNTKLPMPHKFNTTKLKQSLNRFSHR